MTRCLANRQPFGTVRCPVLRGNCATRRHSRTACHAKNPDIPHALLFDCDGVLADTERDGHRVAFNQAFKKMGIPHQWDEKTYGRLLETGGGKERMKKYFDERPEEEPWQSITEADQQEAFVRTLHKMKTEVFQKMIEDDSLPLRPGVAKLVDDAITAGCKVAVCSTSNEEAVQTLVNVKLGTDVAKVMRVFAGDAVPAKKPDPAIYTLAATRLGVEPAKCVVIEDSRIGLRAAKAAGMYCIVTQSTYTTHENFDEADAVFPEIGDGPNAHFSMDDLRVGGKLALVH